MRGQRNVCESNYGMESFSGVGWWHKTAVSPMFRRSSSRLSSFCGSQKKWDRNVLIQDNHDGGIHPLESMLVRHIIIIDSL